MSEPSVHYGEWVGLPVMVNGADVGVLEEVNEWGIVLRTPYTAWWRTAELTPEMTEDVPEDETHYSIKEIRRVSPVFRPWQMVSEIRVLEPDEAEAQGF